MPQPVESRMIWRCGKTNFEFGTRPLIMGVLNVTPDSFSDGNRYFEADNAVKRGLEMAAEGADIIDVGGESTRPGAAPVAEEEEVRRVVPVIKRLCEALKAGEPGRGGRRISVSVDTMKAGVAGRAVEAGAEIVNDVSALTHDPGMADLVRETDTGIVLMHMKGMPGTMQNNPAYDDVVKEVATWLRQRMAALVAQGIEPERIAIDPGIGFGKTVQHNLALLRGLETLRLPGRPVVVGLSRKSVLGAVTGKGADERLAAGIAAMSFCIMKGAHVARVHDVKESVDAVKVLAALAGAEG